MVEIKASNCSQPLGHFGILAGVFKKTKFKERVDKLLPVSQEKGAKITTGERIMAMIYNGLGFIDTRFYTFPESFSESPIKRLFDRKLEAKDFTDDALLRCLDKIHEYGPAKFVFKTEIDIDDFVER